MAAFRGFLGSGATLVGHNIGFDAAFLERHGLPEDMPRLDTAELASIVLPSSTSYALQRLAADASIVPEAAHRALHDALTCGSVLAALSRRARELPPLVLEECRAQAGVLGPAYVAFFERALLSAWQGSGASPSESASPASAPPRVPARVGDHPTGAHPHVGETEGEWWRRQGGGATREERVSAGAAGLARSHAAHAFARLAEAMPGFEERREQQQLAEAVEQTMGGGGVLVAEAGTGIGKSLAYLIPALARAAKGERVIVSTYTLNLQDQLMRKDLRALQAALGTDVPVAVLKGRPNYLCPRRWQAFRGTAATRDEIRLALKTLVWRTFTETGDRAEINLMGGEGALWPRISASDESCDARRCARVAGGCYLERARAAASRAGIVVVNHALLLYDARMRSALLPSAEHVVVDEAHHLEDVAADVFGYRLEEHRVRRDLDRVARSPLVLEALRGDRAGLAAEVQAAVELARERVDETFAVLGSLLPPPGTEDKLRITPAIRAGDDRWLSVELAAERLSDALAGVVAAAERVASGTASEELVPPGEIRVPPGEIRFPSGETEDVRDELASAIVEVSGNRTAIARGIHDPRAGDVVWLAIDAATATTAMFVAPSYVGGALRRAVIERYRSVVMTSATLGVAGSLDFTLDRFGVRDIAATLVLGSPFDHLRQSALIVPTDMPYPQDPAFTADVAATLGDIARALDGRTLALFTSHASMREVARMLEPLEEEGIAVLTQGLGGSRRALVDRFVQGRALLLGTQSFWEGVDLPGDLLRCVAIVKLPFAVPDDPLVAGRSERYDDPFREFQLPQAALRLRQGFGRLIRSKTDFGAVVLLDRRVLERDYGATFIASLPDVRVKRVPREEIASLVVEAARD